MIWQVENNQGKAAIRRTNLRGLKRLLVVVDASAMNEEKRD